MGGISIATLRLGIRTREAIMFRRVVGAFALLVATASSASAVAPPGTRWMINHAGDRIAAMPMHEVTAVPQRIEGKVLAIDPHYGGFLLGTDAGILALRADAKDLDELQIGQTLEVELVEDESPARFDRR
jgi:hypothetical protein